MVTRLKHILESSPLFLFLVPAFVLLHLEKVFHHQINYRFAFAQIFIMIFAIVVFVVFGKLLMREKKKACLTAFILMIAWFYLGLLKNLLKEEYRDIFFSSYVIFLPFSFIAIFLLLYAVRSYKGRLNRLFLFINTLWIIFILVDIISIIVADIAAPSLQKQYSYALPSKNFEDSLKPDIYYIVFDSYSANAVLNKMGFDNHLIEKKLEASGFKIINGSKSNYNLTPFSIASTLNMRYLDAVDTVEKYFLYDYFKAVDMVKWNGLFPWLEKNGYNVETYSFFDFPGHPTINKKHNVWDIDDLFLQHNMALKVYKDIYWNFHLKSFNTTSSIRRAIEQRDAYDDTVFAKLLKAPLIGRKFPKLIYAHFIMPHDPNSYDSLGQKLIYKDRLTKKEKEKLYIEEIIFVNKRINTITDTLLKYARRPLVIIIQGDHGYRFWDNSRNQDEFPNFSAVYFSNRDYSRLPDTLSNVNLFKAVLNTWFRQQISFDNNKHLYLKYR